MFTQLNRNNFICTWAFLTLPHFIFDGLSVIERCVAATTLNFRMVNKQIFSSILGSNKTKSFVCIEPLNCTFAHIVFSITLVNIKNLPTSIHRLEFGLEIFFTFK